MCARRVLRSGPGAETLKGPSAWRRDRRPSVLPFDPMPDRIAPCLALLVAEPPADPDWLYEVKWDGYRLAVHIEAGGKIRIITRGGHDRTHRFPTIAAAAEIEFRGWTDDEKQRQASCKGLREKAEMGEIYRLG